MALIACADVTPLVADLIRRVRPDDDVHVIAAEDLPPEAELPRAAAWVVSADSELADRVRAAAPGRVVLLAGERVRVPDADGPVVRRPVDATDLAVALARVLPATGVVDRTRERVRSLTATTSVEGLYAVLRAAALAAAVSLEAASLSGTATVVLPVVLLSWVLLRVWLRALTVPLVAVDVAMAAAAIVASGATTSPYLLFAAVAGAEVGYAFPSRSGAVLVGTATLAGLVPLMIGMARETSQALDLVTWGTVIPLASMSGVMGQRIHQSRQVDQLVALRHVNTTLERLSRQAQVMVGGLSVGAVVDDALRTLEGDEAVTAGAVLLEEDDAPGLCRLAGGFGLAGHAPSRLLADGLADGTVPGELDRHLPEGQRLVVPMRLGEVDRGAVVAVVAWGRRSRTLTRRVRELAQETALAVDNARMFDSLRNLSADDERRRLARDLHDGVVQSLVHVAFELDLLAMEMAGTHAGGGSTRVGANAEVTRLRTVVAQTVDEVRATVNGLRSVRLADGLGAALAALGRETSTREVAVDVRADPRVTLTPEAELQLLRIAQEAVSNAVQHGRPERIDVVLWQDGGGVHLTVDDDGVGVDTQDAGPTIERGVGLRAMKERADLLGARLAVRPGDRSGTTVRVDLPPGRTDG